MRLYQAHSGSPDVMAERKKVARVSAGENRSVIG
jgi:hypothetical protein